AVNVMGDLPRGGGSAAGPRSRTSRSNGNALHRCFFLEIFHVAEDRSNGQHLVAAAIAHQAVARWDVALDVEIGPFFTLPSVIDRNVVVLAPEERNMGKSLPLPEHVARRRLPLPLGHHPVLDPQILAGMGVGPAGDVAGGENPRHASLEILVHRHAAVGLQAGALGQLDPRPHANADNDELGRQRAAALELDTLAVDRYRGFLEMKYDAVLLVNGADEVAEFAPEYPLQRPVLGSHDMNLDVARAQRRGDLESDEACTDHDRAPRRLRLGDDGA